MEKVVERSTSLFCEFLGGAVGYNGSLIDDDRTSADFMDFLQNMGGKEDRFFFTKITAVSYTHLTLPTKRIV